MSRNIAFFACLYGTITLMAVALVLWVETDFDPHRVAIGIAIGWALLVPWSFREAVRR